jgi:ECF sigma factor
MTPSGDLDITGLLNRIRADDPRAVDELLSQVYADPRRIAAQLMRDEPPGHTLQPTALLHEAVQRLLGGNALKTAPDRHNLFAAVYQAMRRVLVDHARRRLALRRGGAYEQNCALMSADRWQRIADIFHEALTRDPVDRLDFLGQSCGDDVDLRIEIETLLEGRPIAARPVGLWNRSWRWSRRNPKLALVSAALAATVLFGALAFVSLTHRHNTELRTEMGRTQATAASGLVQQLFKVDTPQIPGIVQAIAGYRRWTDPELREAVAAAVDPKIKLHASRALLPVDPSQVSYLQTQLQHADPGQLQVLRDSLQPYRADLTPKLWTALETAKLADPRLLPAAGALALYDASSRRWDSLTGKVAEALVTENSLFVGAWLEALRPVRPTPAMR